MSKKVSFNKEALEPQLNGLDTVCRAVGGTIGPKGLNVSIANSMGGAITNDGFTIAQQITLEDPEENRGAYIARNVASQQNDDVGDGTSTVLVLLQSLIHESLKRPENQMEVKESLKEAGNKVLKILSKKSTPITKDDVEKVAFISAENKQLAKYISEIIQKLGDKATINVEESRTFATDYEIVDGFELPYGYMQPYTSLGRLTYLDVPVIVSQEKISSPYGLDAIFAKLVEQGIKQCLVACSDIEGATLGVLLKSKMGGLFDSLVVRMSAEGLQDLAGATGARAISAENGVNFQNLTLQDLGRAKKIVCDSHKTLVLGESKSALAYAKTLESRANEEQNIYIEQKLRDRIARIKGSVAILRIGAPTDFEREYLKYKAEDAVKAVSAALAEGVCEGGGLTLWRIAQELPGKTIGEQILKKSLIAPFKKIVENAGKEYAEVVMNLPQGFGYDARENKYVNMIESGLCDPTKVERLAVENAVSAASTFTTTFALITDLPKKDE